ncbi:EF-hand domain-containing protein [Luteibacter sp. SG786]|uniref:EF-hand domain-containing protein n=1 Tax=Luteibacter sp. SG786 TaxID=2587130 RepID=UPI00142115AA|nr:EF-hand domain-containing protein [Luteibacter sp. SG786]NII54501.1 hypothetical protein [Luteibacter sp. SG786]
MTYSRSIVSLALVASLSAGVAFAQGNAPQAQSDDSGAPAFSSLNDGKPIRRGDVPKDVDALKELRAHFNEADTNHDGRVDEGEYNAYINKANVKQPQR